MTTVRLHLNWYLALYVWACLGITETAEIRHGN